MSDFTAEEDREWDKKTITIVSKPKVYAVENMWKLDHQYHKFAIISVEKNSVTLYATCRFMLAAKEIVCRVRKQFPDSIEKNLYVMQTNYQIFPLQFGKTLLKDEQQVDK